MCPSFALFWYMYIPLYNIILMCFYSVMTDSTAQTTAHDMQVCALTHQNMATHCHHNFIYNSGVLTSCLV